ncbi:unnamed protein product [Rotaria socialis]|uniref:Uncharacterized protein n=1 Tax=Rotaria socialis TaxID=392032 RepID=A0A819AM22_9BILA|nr:unnamed protein product [Rotaria socialis]CAF4330896.1 unnamed protein product [Rotaria socialis]
MGKRASTKRLSSMSDAASKAIDIKARKRIEELYELTDEIINAYNEVNETYVNKVYRKYKQLQEVNKKLKQQLNHHHCSGCKCTILPNDSTQNEDEEEDDNIEDTDSSTLDENDQIYEQTGKSASSSTTTRSIMTRSKKNNAFLIPDIEDTQHFDVNDSRLSRKSPSTDADNQDRVSMVTNQSENETTHNDNQSEHEEEEIGNNNDEHAQEEEEEEEEEEEGGDDEDVDNLPLALQDIIRKKAQKNKNAKIYLLHIPRYPALCEFLRDRSRTSFDHRPSENQVRPLIANHLSEQMANDAKIRMRLRDELREIHRSYMRTFMNDPHANATKISFHKHKRLNIKQSPM